MAVLRTAILPSKTVQFLVCLLAVPLWVSSADLPDCEQVDECRCVREDGKQVSIRDLGVKGFKKFEYQAGPEGKYEYTYNPCYDFKDDYCTTEIISCQTKLDHTANFGLGTAATAEWGQHDGYYSIHYKDGADGRSTVVELECDSSAKEPKLKVLGEIPEESLVYYFRMTTECACPGVCQGPPATWKPPDAGGLSPGSILCIIFAVLAVVYVIGGVLFMKFVRGADGTELVPNGSFWFSLPGYIKDGFMFVVTCGKRSSYKGMS